MKNWIVLGQYDLFINHKSVSEQWNCLPKQNSESKMSSPGDLENSSHIVKVEIIDNRDLKSVPVSMYWEVVCKKGIFYLALTIQMVRKF